ncbi:MAG: mechanosensitive ion channel family protein [Christensenellales bacterium]|jgi:small-conductance mechanosensitive channel
MDQFFTNIWTSITDFFLNLGNNADQILIAITKIVGIIILAKIVIMILRRIIKKVLIKSKNRKPLSAMAKKSETIESVSGSVAKYAVYFFAITSVLGILGLGATVSSLLATAGIGGIAIAFGAQSLVKDVVSGLFMLFENQFSVGEYIEVDGEKGTVETITIRTTRIRRFTGEITTIPNGTITKVTNYSRGDHLAIIDIPVAYETDIETASKIMQNTGLEYMKNHDNILEEPHVLGITDLGESNIVIRMIIRVKPLTHWDTERDLRRLIKEEFSRTGIKVPYPHRIIVSG